MNTYRTVLPFAHPQASIHTCKGVTNRISEDRASDRQWDGEESPSCIYHCSASMRLNLKEQLRDWRRLVLWHWREPNILSVDWQHSSKLCGRSLASLSRHAKVQSLIRQFRWHISVLRCRKKRFTNVFKSVDLLGEAAAASWGARSGSLHRHNTYVRVDTHAYKTCHSNDIAHALLKGSSLCFSVVRDWMRACLLTSLVHVLQSYEENFMDHTCV